MPVKFTFRQSRPSTPWETGQVFRSPVLRALQADNHYCRGIPPRPPTLSSPTPPNGPARWVEQSKRLPFTEDNRDDAGESIRLRQLQNSDICRIPPLSVFALSLRLPWFSFICG